MGRVEDALVTGVGVGGGHEALDDAEVVIEHLGEGRETVGGARRVGDDLVGVRVLVRVDAHHVGGDVVALGRRGDDDLLGASLEVLGRAGGVDEHAGALDDDLDAERLPGELQGVAVGHNLDGLAVDGDVGVVSNLHVGVEGAEDGVVLHEVGRLLDAAGVVDRDNLEAGLGAAVPAAEEVAACRREAYREARSATRQRARRFARNSKNKDVHPKKRSSNEDRRAENRHAFSHELSSETLGILRDVSELCNAMRARARDVPMRPKPLMATLILASVVVLTAAAWCVEGRRGSATGRCRRVETRGVPHGARRFRGTWDASRK